MLSSEKNLCVAHEVLCHLKPSRPSVDVASVERRDHSLFSVTQPLQPPQFPQKFSPHTVPSLIHRRAFSCAGDSAEDCGAATSLKSDTARTLSGLLQNPVSHVAGTSFSFM